MSLVAYGDSDDGSSDSEVEETTKTPSKNVTLKTIEDDQKAINPQAVDTTQHASPTEKRSKLSSLLPKPHNSSETAVVYSEPQRQLLDLKALQEDNDDEIIEVEEEYVPLSQIKKNNDKPTVEKTTQQKSVGSLFSRMPSPWSVGVGISLGKKRGASDDVQASSSKKGKHPVRIAAPTLVDVDSDDEADEKKIDTKRPKPSKAGSGLSSLLPKPKHSITPTAFNPNKPTAKLSNRPLIPHTLSKKPTQTKTKKKKDEGNASGDEDEDNEPVSFFTFSDKKDTEVSIKKHSATSVVSQSIPESTASSSFTSSIKVSSKPEVSGVELGQGESSVSAPYQSDQNAYDYSTASNTSGYYDSTVNKDQIYDDTDTRHQSYDNSDSTTTTYYQPQDASQHYDYGSYDQSSYTTYYDTQPSSSQYQETAEQQPEDIDIEKIQRLQGRNNRKEQINIIDINAADQTADTKVQLTNLTAEQFAHKSSKKQGNMPSSQQRRKHQITYLAFQAKEREFELQQQWSSNRQTKRQTQAKYGF